MGRPLRVSPRGGGRARGRSPYPALDDPILEEQKGYVYPPQLLVALLPLDALPVGVAAMIVAIVMLALLGDLWILGIRDVRCYAAALLWVPSISGVLLSNVSIPLAFALAVVWRYRDAVWPPAIALGLSVSAKLLFWPMYVWMLATIASVPPRSSVASGRADGRGLGGNRLRRVDRLSGSLAAALRDPGGAELLDRRDGGDARAGRGRGPGLTLLRAGRCSCGASC